MNPPYIGIFPAASETFWESMQKEGPSPHQWAHRAYAELLQADVLPPRLANLVIDCMRAYGATTIGVVANVERPHPTGRDILGFISYGLRADAFATRSHRGIFAFPLRASLP